MKKVTPLKAIRLKCLDCSAGSRHEVKHCVIPDCPLYAFRMGKNPNIKNRKGNISNLKPFANKSRGFPT